MVSELRSGKLEDHVVGMDSPSLMNYIRMRINTARSWIKKVIYYLFNKVKSQGFLVALTGSLNDDNAWIIDSGASRHTTVESKQLQRSDLLMQQNWVTTKAMMLEAWYQHR